MSKPSSVGEKSTAVGEKSKKASEGDFKDQEKPAHPNDTSIETEKDGEKPNITPVPFSQMFRFSTKPEMFIRLQVVGLVAAAGAGAAQPLLSILFGNLTKDFVQFATVLTLAKQGDQEGAARIPEVANSFRRVAAKDASYLVYVGIGIFASCTYAYMYIWVVTGELNAKTRSREISGSHSASRGRVF